MFIVNRLNYYMNSTTTSFATSAFSTISLLKLECFRGGEEEEEEEEEVGRLHFF
jgi:hypothetical protein